MIVNTQLNPSEYISFSWSGSFALICFLVYYSSKSGKNRLFFEVCESLHFRDHLGIAYLAIHNLPFATISIYTVQQN